VARVPFVAGLDQYLPRAFGKLHPRWRTPHVAILVQAVVSGALLILSNVNEAISGAYEVLINATIVIYFIPFLYMYAAIIKLYYRADRSRNQNAVLVPGGKAGVWTVGVLGFAITALSMVLALVPSRDVHDKMLFEVK